MKKTRVQKIKQAFDIFTSTALVMAQFYRYPTVEFSLSEIAGNTGLSKATVSRIIRELRDAGFVTVLNLGVVYRIKADGDSPVYRREKVAYNLHTIIRSNVTEFLAQKFDQPRCIALFGSFRKGEDDKGSDIDIAVETHEDSLNKTCRFREFEDLEKLLERRITVHLFNRKTIDANLFTNIANGIVLYGFLEVSK